MQTNEEDTHQMQRDHPFIAYEQPSDQSMPLTQESPPYRSYSNLQHHPQMTPPGSGSPQQWYNYHHHHQSLQNQQQQQQQQQVFGHPNQISNYQFTNPWQQLPQELSPPHRPANFQQQFPVLRHQSTSLQFLQHVLSMAPLDTINIWGNSQSIWSNQTRSQRPNSVGFGDLSLRKTQRHGRDSFSSTSSDTPLFEMSIENPLSSNRSIDMSLRRHSYGGDVKIVPPVDRTSPLFRPIMMNQSVSSSTSGKRNSFSEPSELSVASKAVAEYFAVDLHERVRVTKKLLMDVFRKEEMYLTESSQLPNFPIENTLKSSKLVIVAFKAGRIDIFYIPTKTEEAWAESLAVGDYVIVEADRGKDLGQVVEVDIAIEVARLMKLLQFQEQQAALSDLVSGETVDATLSIKNLNQPLIPPSLHFPKAVVGLALAYEISQILNKNQDEEKACRLCLAKIANTTSIGQMDVMRMKLIDAEYQYDRKKLIFYYSTSKRIDFRDLVRELFRIYKTRIWMCAVVGVPFEAGSEESDDGVKAFEASQGKNPQKPHQKQRNRSFGDVDMQSDGTSGVSTGNRSQNNHNQYELQTWMNALSLLTTRRPPVQYALDVSGTNDNTHGITNDFTPREFRGLVHRPEGNGADNFALKSIVDSIEH